MLKKNLVRSGFLSPGLLFLMPNSAELTAASNSREDMPSLNVSKLAPQSDTSVRAIDSVVSTPPPPPPIQLNRHASKFVKDYLRKEDEFLQKMKDRSPSYFKVIDAVFEKYGIPREMCYLAIVESQLRTTAVSRVGAKGMWQLMPVTARELGLKVNGRTDERTHLYKSTVAAAKYLRDLHREFGDWLLVLAAYNSGPGTVMKAMKKSGSKNFWALQRFLPEESRGHVKRFIGIHYFFEGEGSITTQTKAEAVAYQKLLDESKPVVQLAPLTKDTVAIVAINAVK